MKFLVVGLGSMGKRRIRCLKALGYNQVFGFDTREDRRAEVEQNYKLETFTDFLMAINEAQPDALIISVPPDLHHQYIKQAITFSLPFFVEASVVDTDMELIKEKLAKKALVAAPSATLLFHPAIVIISQILNSGELGKISNVVLHSGQYLPDWHSYEKVNDYYVSNPITGGGREIVPFELTWVTKLFGFPKRVCGNFRKTIEIAGADTIDDTYNFLLDYENFLASITVDVVSRHATRRLMINGNKKQLIWDWDFNYIKLYDPETTSWEERTYIMEGAAIGYNQNIGENMYIEEIRCFVEAVEGKHHFVNSMEHDHKVLELLYAIEEADNSSVYVRFE
ncbi:Gfo/Idh/MocA family oxidoreductase [Desulfosporosinus sp. Sb-LF]|uniref:Gfo/Idh/MocA family protein n=1 Tax=Desulfosporosinus sp. Sb-LF TaxID=2560027 RepID=UPI00107F050A|nr:Gfo/Idh/MocA family oxidoreductase [Desulfosporosinus sp. Sb-LF]TGE33016.1 Gfo/Idh/MocA family oxidoreductase [Desulfosporosinus sp. Sb-LF]